MIVPPLATGLGFDFDGLACVGIVAIIVFLATSTRRSARQCPRCREINRQPAIYCAQCGTRLPDK